MNSAERRANKITTHLIPNTFTIEGEGHNNNIVSRQFTSSSTGFTNPHQLKFYINGEWVDPVVKTRRIEVINPVNENIIGYVSNGCKADVDKAVEAATRAFQSYSQTTREERLALLEKIKNIYTRRMNEIAETISLEMGCPISFSRQMQAPAGLLHIKQGIEELKKFQFFEEQGDHSIVREPIGVVGMITPWNWPINQITCKVIPALACGCTMVLKPSEIAPFDGIIWAEILHEAGVPKGVFNLVNGTGIDVGDVIASHPGINAVTFTGSTRAGISIAKAAAESVKRVSQELGGKTPNIILPDADLEESITLSVKNVLCNNAGQSCNAPTRLLIPAHLHERASSIAKRVAESIVVGDTWDPKTELGPVVCESQWVKIENYIQKGIDEGATLVTGGVGKPEQVQKNNSKGFFVKPTVFSNVKNNMTIAREEIFGPVLCILPYRTEEEALQIANDTPYGLSSEIYGKDADKMRRLSTQLRAGAVRFNGAMSTLDLPFGGYKQSGNGREWGKWAFHEFLEIKALVGINNLK